MDLRIWTRDKADLYGRHLTNYQKPWRDSIDNPRRRDHEHGRIVHLLGDTFDNARHVLLYSDLDPEASGAIIQRLEARASAKVMNNGREIRVPTNQVGALRIKLASQGLPSDGSMGYKIFDETDALGTTNFVQNVNLVRALEGELSRTIRVINGVKTARVHLVLPRRELFSREKQEPSASIVLKMSGRGRLNSEQVSAIQHLVATAIPGLNPNHISIIDDKGSLLAAGFEQTGPEASAAKPTNAGGNSIGDDPQDRGPA